MTKDIIVRLNVHSLPIDRLLYCCFFIFLNLLIQLITEYVVTALLPLCFVNICMQSFLIDGFHVNIFTRFSVEF